MRAAEKTSSFNLFWLLNYISIASVSAAIITPALPKIQTEYGLGPGIIEWIVSAFLIGYVAGQLVYAPLANRYGRLKALRTGLVINLVGIVICLFALSQGSYWLLVGGRLITALGAASGLACTFMLINEWLPETQRKTAMAYSVLSFALGIGIAVVIGGLITEYLHWQGCFWILLIHGLIMLWGTCVFSETLIQPKSIHVLTIIRDYYAALASAKLVIFSLVVGCCSAISYCFSAAGPQIAEQLLKLSAAEYGYWNILNIVGMLMGGLFAKQLLARFSANQLIAVGFLGVALGIVNLLMMWHLGSQSSLWFFLITASLYLFSSFLFSGGSFVASNALSDKASAAAMMSFVNMCFATLGVIVMGYLMVNPLLSFVIILSIIWLLVVGLLLIRTLKVNNRLLLSDDTD
ncbi:MFS transporter [Fluoribacter gormanii]|uniref:Predicted arabinose efflux permease, MFS family n=1 Tax=Fluoribacter gormanii TaxID=464 RepID=A0A377GII7_9GAMM|nr:MFS transporter [Fluoribacter gormanii]KTD03328.1 major facilitator superfamily (MFS) transporter [Fluoribacter gormanii]MCW8444083.1 MFS transporter [Fluoribacter gormanii]SIQ53446.1 Predicted arabinose efflux permease, MFS family [Fluoribacter gormanii]STO24355.1 Sulfonamide resistance protein [Fluoribacter gormanii]